MQFLQEKNPQNLPKQQSNEQLITRLRGLQVPSSHWIAHFQAQIYLQVNRSQAFAGLRHLQMHPLPLLQEYLPRVPWRRPFCPQTPTARTAFTVPFRTLWTHTELALIRMKNREQSKGGSEGERVSTFLALVFMTLFMTQYNFKRSNEQQSLKDEIGISKPNINLCFPNSENKNKKLCSFYHRADYQLIWALQFGTLPVLRKLEHAATATKKKDQRSCPFQLSSSEPQFSEEAVLKRLKTDVCIVGKKKISKIKSCVKSHHESNFAGWRGAKLAPLNSIRDSSHYLEMLRK